MATPINLCFPQPRENPFLLNKQKKREPSPDVVYRQNGDSAGDLGLSQLLVFAFHLLFLIAIYFWAFILFALFLLCNIYCDSFQFFISSHTYILLFVYSHTSL